MFKKYGSSEIKLFLKALLVYQEKKKSKQVKLGYTFKLKSEQIHLQFYLSSLGKY
jgi:hypothetical protein